jgi:hypothetical protein
MGGHVAKKLGDGLMSLFGYPVAHENDAERAALAIQGALLELNRKNQSTGKPVLTARIGVETGPAVLDAAGEIYGDVVNTFRLSPYRLRHGFKELQAVAGGNAGADQDPMGKWIATSALAE